jgi:hypothetical protein
MANYSALAARNGFEALVTKDSGIAYEQNLNALPCTVFILEAKSNSLEHIQPLVPALLAAISVAKPKSVVRIR